jgi:hypothetical protein
MNPQRGQTPSATGADAEASASSRVGYVTFCMTGNRSRRRTSSVAPLPQTGQAIVFTATATR